MLSLHRRWLIVVTMTFTLFTIISGCGQPQPKAVNQAPAVKPKFSVKDEDILAAMLGEKETRQSTVDLETARKQFTSKLTKIGPAPQRFVNEKPPAGATEVKYKSGELELKGWLSTDPGDGKKRPAVVYLHGGFAFSSGDWEDAEAFAKAGFVLFMPMLRAENGGPGHFESFLGEVDDAIAAGRYVAGLPNVDADNVFVAGHSVGAVLTCLSSMLPSKYKAAAALDGGVNMALWARAAESECVPYNINDPQEIQVRNPMANVASLRCPIKLYSGIDTIFVNAPLARQAARLGKNCELVRVPGNHQAMVEPAVKLAIVWFQQQSAK